MSYPEHRPRRLRRNEEIRRMVRETKLSVDDLIWDLDQGFASVAASAGTTSGVAGR